MGQVTPPIDNDRQEKDIIARLSTVLQARKLIDPKLSYVASLYGAGLDRILKKVGEEATETIIAAKGDDKQAVIHETADLWFHTMVMLHALDLTANDVLVELERRYNTN